MKENSNDNMRKEEQGFPATAEEERFRRAGQIDEAMLEGRDGFHYRIPAETPRVLTTELHEVTRTHGASKSMSSSVETIQDEPQGQRNERACDTA